MRSKLRNRIETIRKTSLLSFCFDENRCATLIPSVLFLSTFATFVYVDRQHIGVETRENKIIVTTRRYVHPVSMFVISFVRIKTIVCELSILLRRDTIVIIISSFSLYSLGLFLCCVHIICCIHNIISLICFLLLFSIYLFLSWHF